MIGSNNKLHNKTYVLSQSNLSFINQLKNQYELIQIPVPYIYYQQGVLTLDATSIDNKEVYIFTQIDSFFF